MISGQADGLTCEDKSRPEEQDDNPESVVGSEVHGRNQVIRSPMRDQMEIHYSQEINY